MPLTQNDINEKGKYDAHLTLGYDSRNHDSLHEHTVHQSKQGYFTNDNCDTEGVFHQLLTPENNKSLYALDTCSSSQSTLETMRWGQQLQHSVYSQQDVEQQMYIQHHLDPDVAYALNHDTMSSQSTVSVAGGTAEVISSQESCQSSCDTDKSTLALEQTSEETITDLQSKAAFSVDKSKISAVPTAQQADELRDLDLVVFNQNEFEEGNINCVWFNFKEQMLISYRIYYGKPTDILSHTVSLEIWYQNYII